MLTPLEEYLLRRFDRKHLVGAKHMLYENILGGVASSLTIYI